MMLYRYQYLALSSAHADERSERLRRLRQVIVESKLRLTSPLNFNDPYDHRTTVADPTPEQLKRFLEREKQTAAEWVATGRMTQKRADEVIKEIVSRFGTPRAIQAWAEEMVQRALNGMGVACFSELRDNILMWGYYANSHAGVCLGFDSDRCPILRSAQKVDYVPVPIPFNYFSDFAADVAMMGTDARKDEVSAICLSKWLGWQHEAEWRLVTDPDSVPADRFVTFESAALTEISFGYRTPDSAIDDVRKLVRERKFPVQLYKVTPVRDGFALRFDPLPA